MSGQFLPQPPAPCEAEWAGEDCTTGDIVLGMCTKHYVRFNKYGNPHLVKDKTGLVDLKEEAALIAVGKRRCVLCNRTKPLHLFPKGKAFRHGRRPCCRKCFSETPTARNARNGVLRRQYGISADDYDALLAFQGGKCAICHGGTTKRFFHVDHDHKTGEVRGLLCFLCNVGLSQFRDKVENLRAAVRYREAPPFRRLRAKQEQERTQGVLDLGVMSNG